MKLMRVTYTDEGTFGVLLNNFGFPLCVTLENPWMQNKPFISCIPPGQYEVWPINSPKFGATWEVTPVVDRTHILFHRGNTHIDTHGCILIGERFGMLSGRPAILGSNTAFTHLMAEWADNKTFILSIHDINDVPF